MPTKRTAYSAPPFCSVIMPPRRLTNTTDTHKPTLAARHSTSIRTFILFVCAVCGPILSIVISILYSVDPTPDSVSKGTDIRKASTVGLLFASAFLFLLASWCCVTAVRSVTLGLGSMSWHQHPHIMVSGRDVHGAWLAWCVWMAMPASH